MYETKTQVEELGKQKQNILENLSRKETNKEILENEGKKNEQLTKSEKYFKKAKILGCPFINNLSQLRHTPSSFS